ncbi:MAG TPA: diaminopimelate decarboxylase [Candidatus Avisuccinivibrio pullicola]|nr:diaminopimelate decarboxylase [Candidatus Avisuccinivibrio pullicola]
MDYFNYRGAELYAEELKVADLALKYGTPLYIYSKATLERHVRAFEEALKGRPHLVCYAVKANSNLAILELMASMGVGFDVVSAGELSRVLRAGGRASDCVYSGVGKRRDEIAFALKAGIRCLNLESEAELEAVSAVARELNVVAPVAVRVNPDVDARTHPSISTGLKQNKFGIAFERAYAVYERIAADPHLKVSGIDCHIGSQMTSGAPIVEATQKLLDLYGRLRTLGISIDHIDIGGGLGVTYGDETPPSPYEYMQAVLSKIGDPELAVFVEPGRAMVANAGILVTETLYLKDQGDKRFAIVDAGMNDLIRPALYNSWMNIIEVQKSADKSEKRLYDVVGPVCESDDFLGRERRLAVKEGDFLAVRGAGAYGMAMASTYNSRPLCAEIMVDGDRVHVIRDRQSLEDLWRGEHLLNGE